ncbi:6109_t:CDS:2, partial [Ambispora leptoticha]
KYTSAIRRIQWRQESKVLLLFSCGASEKLRCWKVEIRDKSIVITGDEDNVVAVAMLYTSRRGMDVYNMLDAHPSSIQGVHLINDTTFVTSLDQRLNVWKLVKKKIDS